LVKTAIILAGGFATRLGDLANNLPKALQLINNKPFLLYKLEEIEKMGIFNVVICVGHMHQQIIKSIGYKYNKINIMYSVEHSPLGTGGAIKKFISNSAEKMVLITNGDTLLSDVDENIKNKFLSSIKTTLLVNSNDNKEICGIVEIYNNGRIKNIYRGDSVGSLRHLGYTMLEVRVLNNFVQNSKFDFEIDFINIAAKNEVFYTFSTTAESIDIGTQERLRRSSEVFKKWKIN